MVDQVRRRLGLRQRARGPEAGVGFHCTWGSYTDADRLTILDRLQAEGVHWVRISIAWSGIENLAKEIASPDVKGTYDGLVIPQAAGTEQYGR